MSSSNVMIDVMGMEPVNDLLDELGLRDTRLQRKMYDLEARKRGAENVTTAQDMADLLQFLWFSARLTEPTREQLLAIGTMCVTSYDRSLARGWTSSGSSGFAGRTSLSRPSDRRCRCTGDRPRSRG